MMKITVADTTLRDGAQACGISYSLQDKLRIIAELDALGVGIIEVGNPFGSPTDRELLSCLPKTQAKLAVFGSTRRREYTPESDPGLSLLASAPCPVAVLFGKSSKSDAITVLQVTPQENLDMIYGSVKFLRSSGKEVIYDAEHFFDACTEDYSYALSTIQAARSAGAEVCLCDTCGGALPADVFSIVSRISSVMPVSIHAHNDSGLAAAVTLEAVRAGATGIQGTLLGTGERCGNASLSTVVPTLVLKMGFECGMNLPHLQKSSRAVAEISNITIDGSAPYIGRNAFSHKAGMHVDAILKKPGSYEHIDPAAVGNKRRFVLSEYSGRGALIKKIENLFPDATKASADVDRLLEQIKELEKEGFMFEGADASLEMLVLRGHGEYKNRFALELFKVTEEQSYINSPTAATAVVKVTVDGKSEMTASEGSGPVDALDRAMRRALEVFYPSIKDMRLTDFKVRVLDSAAATAARVRVLVESFDGKNYINTVGVSTDIIEASVMALVDSMEYKLYRDSKS